MTDQIIFQKRGSVGRFEPKSREWRPVNPYNGSNPNYPSNILIIENLKTQTINIFAVSNENQTPFLRIILEDIADIQPSVERNTCTLRVLSPGGIAIYSFFFQYQPDANMFLLLLSDAVRGLSSSSHINAAQAFIKTGNMASSSSVPQRIHSDTRRNEFHLMNSMHNNGLFRMNYPTLPQQNQNEAFSTQNQFTNAHLQHQQHQNMYSQINATDLQQKRQPSLNNFVKPEERFQQPLTRRRTDHESPSHETYAGVEIQNLIKTSDGFKMPDAADEIYSVRQKKFEGNVQDTITKVERETQLGAIGAEAILSTETVGPKTVDSLTSSEIPVSLHVDISDKDSKVQENLSNKEPQFFKNESSSDTLCDLLAEAIDIGDIEKAKEIAVQLTNRRAKLTIQMLCNDGDISQCVGSNTHITVQIEDKHATKPTLVKLDLNPAQTTIGNLKYMFFQKYKFPIKVQRWIVGKRLPDDNMNLNSLGVKTTGTVIFLYLLSAKEAEITAEEEESRELKTEEYNNDTHSGDIRNKTSNINQHKTQLNPLANDFHSVPVTGNIPGRDPYLSYPRQLQEPESLYQRFGILQSLSGNDGISHSSVGRENDFFDGLTFGLEQEQLQRNAAPHLNTNQPSNSMKDYSVVQPDTFHEPQKPPPIPPRQQGWLCPRCTFFNLPTRPGCEMCGFNRPQDYNPPLNLNIDEREKERLKKEAESEIFLLQLQEQEQAAQKLAAMNNFADTLQTAQMKLIPNPEEFECEICYAEVPAREGVLLRECLHSFCRDCLAEHIKASEDPEVRCPYNQGQPCDETITGQEISEILSEEDYLKYLDRCLNTAENKAANSFHCKTPNCKGWCIYEDEVNWFPCPLCKKRNCLTCKAIHEQQTCKEYQDDIKRRSADDEAAKKTQKMLDDMLRKGNAMNCPQCKVVLQKKDGCDWIRCSMCRTEICWVTRGRRWGPNGHGDTSGGCRCRINGVPCHPKCGNCH